MLVIHVPIKYILLPPIISNHCNLVSQHRECSSFNYIDYCRVVRNLIVPELKCVVFMEKHIHCTRFMGLEPVTIDDAAVINLSRVQFLL